MVKFTTEEKVEMVFYATHILIGDYDAVRKYAASLILKALLPYWLYRKIMEDDGVYPFDRNDPRVRRWRKEVLKRGVCERCGSKDELDAHHVMTWAEYPKGRADLNNGMCLCHECHTEAHRFDRSYYMMKSRKRKRK